MVDSASDNSEDETSDGGKGMCYEMTNNNYFLLTLYFGWPVVWVIGQNILQHTRNYMSTSLILLEIYYSACFLFKKHV